MKSAAAVVLLGIMCAYNLLFSQALSPDFVSELKSQLIRKDEIILDQNPEYTVNGIWQYRDKVNWLSGFLGGELWYTWEMTGEHDLRKRAVRHAERRRAVSRPEGRHRRRRAARDDRARGRL